MARRDACVEHRDGVEDDDDRIAAIGGAADRAYRASEVTMRVGIDGSSARDGGGITYLAELLRHADPERDRFERVVLWGGKTLLGRLPQRPWLDLVHVEALDGRLPSRVAWQSRELGRLAGEDCDVLFVPGGSYRGAFRPFVTMFRNMLPFDAREMRRYGLSYVFFRLLVLRWMQPRTFRAADGVIFLNDYARQVCARRGIRPLRSAVVPHGISDEFRIAPRPQVGPPSRLVYTSIIDVYKHQWNVAEAVQTLRREGLPVTLDLVGRAYGPALRKLQSVMRRDPDAVRIVGAVPHQSLPALYRNAESFVFASTCENMPNILIEAMAAGLPIACSDRRPMPDILGDGGIYFDAEDPASIATALRRLLTDSHLRSTLSRRAHNRSEQYSWTRCAQETFAFLRDVAIP
jgi:glycosyltransferase involved in cell wall biosynthesis